MSREEIAATVLLRTGGRVLAGPFAGLRLEHGGHWGDGDIIAKLLGLYEQELHPALSRLDGESFDAMVNIGAAEGFYAIGLALLCPRAEVHAFEADEREHAALRANATLNGVAERIRMHGACGPSDLVALAGEQRRLFVLCDCEGFETVLFTDPAMPGALARSDLLIECHDFADPDCTPKIFAALWRTHQIEVIYPSGRDPNAFPFLSGYSDIDRWMAICENRPTLMNFLHCRAR